MNHTTSSNLNPSYKEYIDTYMNEYYLEEELNKHQLLLEVTRLCEEKLVILFDPERRNTKQFVKESSDRTMLTLPSMIFCKNTYGEVKPQLLNKANIVMSDAIHQIAFCFIDKGNLESYLCA